MSRSSPRLAQLFRFALIAGVLLAAYYYPADDENSPRLRFFDAYLAGYAQLTGYALRMFEPNLIVSGRQIIGRAVFEIVRGCDAIDVLILLVAAILAFPCAWRERLRALPVAIVIVMALNIARICSLYFVQIYAPAHFEYVHMEVWPLLLVLLTAGMFLWWSAARFKQSEA